MVISDKSAALRCQRFLCCICAVYEPLRDPKQEGALRQLPADDRMFAREASSRQIAAPCCTCSRQSLAHFLRVEQPFGADRPCNAVGTCGTAGSRLSTRPRNGSRLRIISRAVRRMTATGTSLTVANCSRQVCCWGKIGPEAQPDEQRIHPLPHSLRL